MTPEEFRAYQLELQRKRRAERKAAGRCVHCGSPVVTETMCERHRTDTGEASRSYYEQPQGRMVKASQQRRSAKRKRAEQGFQSTRTGQAAIAAYMARNLPGR